MEDLCENFQERDEFKRKIIADKLINLLISNEISISPMAIDGNWGIGKSEFCLKTINLLKAQYSEQYHVVYIDSFKSDYTGEPLLALLGEIINTCYSDQETRNKLIDTMGNAAGFLLKTVMKTAVKYVVKEGIDDLKDEFNDAIHDTATAVIDNSVKALLKEQVEAEKNIKVLQKTLSEITQDKEIIIFVDELDRCRPDYAIDMLEVIKHIFNLPKIKIVLVANLEQLKLAISYRYGINADSQRYLDKFIKFSLLLPNQLGGYFGEKNNSYEYFFTLVSKYNLYLLRIEQDIKDFVKILINEHNISLREIESIVRLLQIYFILSGEQAYRRGITDIAQRVIVFCVFMAIINPKLMHTFRNYTVDAKELAVFLGIHFQEISDSAELNEILFLLAFNHANKNGEIYQLPNFNDEGSCWYNLNEELKLRCNLDLSYLGKNDSRPFMLFNTIIDTLSLCS